MGRCVKENEHGRIITTAAKQHLAPLGCSRRGKSRFWFSDESFWLIGISFEPSSFRQGTYLLVGVQWLWHVKPYFSFDKILDIAGRSQKPWVQFESEAQFLPEVERLIARAASDIELFRDLYSSLSSIAHDLEATANTRSTVWQVFHAAVATALAQERPRSRKLFERVIAEPVHHEWQASLNAEAVHLASLVSDRDGFRQAILDRVVQNRGLRRLDVDRERIEMAIGQDQS